MVRLREAGLGFGSRFLGVRVQWRVKVLRIRVLGLFP